jgi:hypothetical protein
MKTEQKPVKVVLSGQSTATPKKMVVKSSVRAALHPSAWAY